MDTRQEAPIHGLLCLEDVSDPPVVEAPGDVLEQAGRNPPEIHINLWEGDQVLLDIGLMIDVATPARQLQFFLPFAVDEEKLEDLSTRFHQPSAISAIFNEAWTISRDAHGGMYVSSPRQSARANFTIVSSTGSARVHKHRNEGHEIQAISLDLESLKRKSAAALRAAERMYVRFRIHDVPQAFYRVGIHQRDWFMASNWQEIEVIDFRLNVRRGAPTGLETSANGRYLDFGKVHFFLMKSHEHEIVFEGPLFKACRSLEDEKFWATYSLAGDADKHAIDANMRRVRSSLGYQWSKTAPTPGGALVAEFDILARFRKMRFGVWTFLIAAAGIGALGNAFWDGLKEVWGVVFH